MKNHEEKTNFIQNRNLVIVNSIMYFAIELSFIIIALVIYKSAIVASKDETEAGQPHEINLRSELRDQTYLESDINDSNSQEYDSISF